ncbi:hypothetical protein ES708_09525 [subsurface metagenome]
MMPPAFAYRRLCSHAIITLACIPIEDHQPRCRPSAEQLLETNQSELSHWLQQTYNHLEWLTEEARKCDIEVIRVRKGNIREDILNAAELKTRFASMPFHCVYNSKPGMLRRQCTSDYKIIPIHKKIRELLGYKPRQRIPKDAVEQWIGISTDESHRVFGFYDHTWLNNSFPLLAKGMTRSSCELWLHENYPGLEVAKSACLGCPFRCNAEWREVKANEGEWTEVIEFDNSIRVFVSRLFRILSFSSISINLTSLLLLSYLTLFYFINHGYLLSALTKNLPWLGHT